MTIRKPYFIIFAVAALSILALGFRAATVNAADAVRASRLDIEIWPEFDKAGMALVIMRVQLPTEAALPASINLRLPASVSAPSAVASAPKYGQDLKNQPYTVAQDGQSSVVSFSTPDPFVQFEYYEPLKVDGAAHAYAFVWNGDIAADQFAISVQQPAGGTNLTTDPALGAPAAGSYGLMVSSTEMGPFEAGKTLTVNVSYQKSDPRTSADILGLEPQQASATSSGGKGNLPMILAAIGGFALVGAVSVYVIQRRRQAMQEEMAAPMAVQPRRVRRAMAAAGAAAGGHEREDGPNFCSNCGSRLRGLANFCSRCGSALG